MLSHFFCPLDEVFGLFSYPFVSEGLETRFGGKMSDETFSTPAPTLKVRAGVEPPSLPGSRSLVPKIQQHGTSREPDPDEP